MTGPALWSTESAQQGRWANFTGGRHGPNETINRWGAVTPESAVFAGG
jgi:hypothetical protein